MRFNDLHHKLAHQSYNLQQPKDYPFGTDMPPKLSLATRTVHASIGQVWGIVAAYGGECLWFPNVTKSTLEGFGVGSTRSLWFGNGPDGKEAWDDKAVREQLVHADGAAYSLRWQIFNDNIGEVLSFSTLKLRAISDNTTEITWSGETTFPDGPERDGLKVFIEAIERASLLM
ncbi:hypothetical protein HYQ44_008413 [Verticillium longisporum]|nr:hypothetical protein HYQ44_008413 [Verticillium longisporum]